MRNCRQTILPWLVLKKPQLFKKISNSLSPFAESCKHATTKMSAIRSLCALCVSVVKKTKRTLNVLDCFFTKRGATHRCRLGTQKRRSIEMQMESTISPKSLDSTCDLSPSLLTTLGLCHHPKQE